MQRTRENVDSFDCKLIRIYFVKNINPFLINWAFRDRSRSHIVKCKLFPSTVNAHQFTRIVWIPVTLIAVLSLTTQRATGSWCNFIKHSTIALLNNKKGQHWCWHTANSSMTQVLVFFLQSNCKWSDLKLYNGPRSNINIPMENK